MRYDVGRFRRPMRRSTEGQLMSLISLGDGSTLTLDFTTGVLDPRLTFTRASTGTFINASGNVATASNNVARFDHDPTTLAPKGLLIEGTATNYLTGFAAGGWGRQNVDGSGTAGALANGQTGPDGVANTAARITTAAATTFPANMFVAFATNAAGATRTFSVWLRGVGSNTTASIAIVGSNTPAGVASLQSGHSVTLATSTSGNNLLALVTGLSTTAWTRVSISRTDAQASSDSYRICPGNHTGTISSGLAVDVYVPQAESGIGMSSTIPTGASTVSRVADSCVMTGANFSSWFAGATEGVLYAEFERPRSQSGALGHDHAAVGTPYSSGAGWILYATVSDFWPTTLLWPTGGPIFPGGFPTSIPLVSKQAARWFGGNDATNFANGLQGTTGAGSGTLTPTMLSIGANSVSGTQADRDFLNACVRRVKFWPIALPNSQIIALTT